MSDCRKLIYTPTTPDMYAEPNPDADDTVQGYDQPETVLAAAAIQTAFPFINARTSQALMDLFAPLRNLTGGG